MFTKKDGKKIYLEIHNTYLLLIVLKKDQSDFILDSSTTQIVPLDNLEFNEGTVNNPSTITKFIKNYIDSHNIKSTEAVVCLRNAEKRKEESQNFLTLQVSLLVVKAGLTISKIVHGPIMPWNNTSMLDGKIPTKALNAKKNLFSILTPPKSTNPQPWIYLSSLLLLASAVMMFHQYTQKQGEVSNLQVTLGSITHEKINESSQEITLLEKEHNQKLTLIKNIDSTKTNDSYSKVLKVLAKNVPENSWLESVKKDKGGKIEVVCNSLKSRDVSTLLKRLGKEPSLKDISLENLNSAQKEGTVLYTFTLQGQLT